MAEEVHYQSNRVHFDRISFIRNKNYDAKTGSNNNSNATTINAGIQKAISDDGRYKIALGINISDNGTNHPLFLVDIVAIQEVKVDVASDEASLRKVIQSALENLAGYIRAEASECAMKCAGEMNIGPIDVESLAREIEIPD
jgi:hypothetical protein